MFPKIQIVDNLDTGRVLFDFNPGKSDDLQRWVSGSEASPLGEPSWDTSPTGLVEGTREIVIPLVDQGNSAEASMAVLSELLTRTSRLYLQWQTRPGSESIWFELVPTTAGGALDFSRVWWDDVDRSAWQWKVTLTAKAFALGARETLTPTTELGQAGYIVNDPIEIVDQIKGTAPAPLNLDVGAGNLSGWRCRLSSWAYDHSLSAFPYMFADPSVSTWTTTTSGAQSLATASMIPGQYRGMVYVERMSGNGSCRVQVGVRNLVDGHLGSTTIPQYTWTRGRAVTPQGASIGYWVDTGALNLPFGVDSTRLSEAPLPMADFYVSIATDGSGTQWKLSRLGLLPVSGPLTRAMGSSLSAAWGYYPERAGFLRIDGENRSVSCVDSSGAYQYVPSPIVDGGFPSVFPGARNFLMFMPRVNDVETAYRYGSWGDAAETTMWYYPRYLHVGGR